MEVRPGYNRTEVGVFPETWEVKPLIGSVSISHGFAFSSKYFAEHGPFRLTTPGHFFEEGGFRDIGEKQKFYLGPVSSEYVLRLGDMIVAMTEQADGLLGSVALIPEADVYLHNQRLGLVKALSTEVDLGFLFYVFNSAGYRAKVRETAAGTKVRHTSPEKLLEIPVPWPPPIEQSAIAAALSDVDALSGALERLVAKKRDLKLATMQQLLTGKTRLPPFKGQWKAKRLGDLSRMASGGTPLSSVSSYYDGDLPWVSISDMTRAGKIIFETERNLTAIGLAKSAAQMFPMGTVLYAMYASLGECSIAGIPLCTSQAILGIQPKESLDSEFLFYFLTWLKPVVRTLGQHGTQANLNKGMVQDFVIQLPDISEQAAIAAVLRDLDAEIEALEQRLIKTRDLKQAMMQELLTGRIRLVEPEACHA